MSSVAATHRSRSRRTVSLLPAQLGLDDHLALRHGLVRKNTDRLLAVRRGGLAPQRQQFFEASEEGAKGAAAHTWYTLPPPQLTSWLGGPAGGAAPLLAVVLAYGRTGEVPVAEIEAICERVGLRPVGK